MKLQQLVQPDRVMLGLTAPDADGALSILAERIALALEMPQTALNKALSEREHLGSTAVGDGFAIPHCKIHGIDDIYIAFARFDPGVEFHAPDKRPVQAMFVVLSPPDQPAAHLQVLSQIARVLKRKEFREEMLRARDASEIVRSVHHAAEAEGL